MADENQGGGEKKKNNRNRNRNRNKNRNRKKSSGNSENRNNTPRNNNGSKKKSNNRRRPKRRYKLSKEDTIYNKYLTMMEQHLAARKKYFALFDRADPQQRAKLERNFTNTMNKVREFENSLEGEDREKFLARVNGLTFDSTYSENHEIPFDGEKVPADLPSEDPHFLETQKASDFSSDTEESVGSMEDYLAYKGL
ncbi:MAG: hypothetical protein CME70_16225 [Halobacteriovorax sp.]|nr:hypothetical protein [Halobacteriovorax sp.]|tara:strand:+ start:112674 stop:113261 length:588 start_codon:yes stop_codon:yes gene_type:complete